MSKKDLFVPLKDVESVVSDLSAGLSAYEISYRKEKCVPVFKLKKAIEKVLNTPYDFKDQLNHNEHNWFISGKSFAVGIIEKELGLSKTRKEPEIPDISPFLGYMLKKKEVGK